MDEAIDHLEALGRDDPKITAAMSHLKRQWRAHVLQDLADLEQLDYNHSS